MEQTTRQTQYIDRLLARIDDMKARILALKAKIAFLEKRLEQREQKTISHYQRVQPYLKSMREKVFAIFLEQPYNLGLTYEEVIAEFKKRYPDIPTKNLPRRTRELCEQGKLWTRQNSDGKVRFFLKLTE